MGLIKQTESYAKGVDVPTISPIADRPTNVSVNKDRRILVQGVLQAVIQSQGLLLEPGDYLQKVEQTTLRLVKFVEENSK